MISPYLPQTPPIYLPFTSIAVASLFDKPIFKSTNICIFKIMFTCVKQERWQNPGLGDRRSRGWWNMLKTVSTNIFPKYLCVLSVLRLTQLQFSHSVMSDSLQPYGLQPARLLYPWDSPDKNTGVGCHALLQGILIRGLNPHLLCLLNWQVGFLPLLPPGKLFQITPFFVSLSYPSPSIPFVFWYNLFPHLSPYLIENFRSKKQGPSSIALERIILQPILFS